MNLYILLIDLKFLWRIYLIYHITKFWSAALGIISISLIYLSNFRNELKDRLSMSIGNSTSLNYSSTDSNISDKFLIVSKEKVSQLAISITNHWFSGGILLGAFIFIALMSLISFIKSIFLIYKYSKFKIKDNSLLFNFIDKLYKGEQINFIDSDDSTKLLIVYLYNLKIIEQ